MTSCWDLQWEFTDDKMIKCITLKENWINWVLTDLLKLVDVYLTCEYYCEPLNWICLVSGVQKESRCHVVWHLNSVFLSLLGWAAVPVHPGLQGSLQGVCWAWPTRRAVDCPGVTCSTWGRGGDQSAQEGIHLRVQSASLLWRVPGNWKWGEGGQDTGRRWSFVLDYL